MGVWHGAPPLLQERPSFVVRLDDHRPSRTSTSCGEPRQRVFHLHALAPSLLHQLRSELSQIYCARTFFVFLTRGANRNGWPTFKTPRSLAASMETVSEENHQRGSFAETKITGCHDSTLLQLGKKAQIIRQKKKQTSRAPRSRNAVRVRIWGRINICVVGVPACSPPPIPPRQEAIPA